MEYLYNELTERIIGCAYKVHNTLGSGFLEKVYENALAIELEKNGFKVEKQKGIKVFYDAKPVGEYFADLLVDGKIIIELKVAAVIDNIHEAQLINYLQATGIKLGLIINFGKKVSIKRIIR
jgi:GxxExxY protein